MGFYTHSKEKRKQIVENINTGILNDIHSRSTEHFTEYFNDDDTYIRKAAYLSVGKAVKDDFKNMDRVIQILDELITHDNYLVRQTVINAAGEIGKKNLSAVERFFEKGLHDKHHAPRNAVIGSIKKMSEVNPEAVIRWARKFLHHPDKEIRREICHGIELRGRTRPQDILPLLKELQHDETARVRNTLVHVLGQISYKEGCLQTVVHDLKSWKNKELVQEALEEIIDVHQRYKNFAFLTEAQAREYIRKNIP